MRTVCMVILLCVAGRASAEVTLFGDVQLPPTTLPVAFFATSGVVAEQAQTIGALQVNPGDYVIGGASSSSAACIVITPGAGSATISAIEILPSLDVYHNAGTDNTGQVHDTLIVDGQVRFVGFSWSDDPVTDIEATTWDGAVPTGYGFLTGLTETSEFYAGAETGFLVGQSAQRPIVADTGASTDPLPGPPSGRGRGIRADGRLIVGELNIGLAYWRPDGLGGWQAFENVLDLPPDVFNAGILYGAQRHYVYGEVLHMSGLNAGGIWDANTNALVQLFDPGLSVTAATTLAGHHVFAVNPNGAASPPAVHVLGQGTIDLIDVFGHDLTGTGLTALTAITDIFPGSAVFLGAGESATESLYFVGSVAIHPPADFDLDGDVDTDDVDLFRDCRSGPAIPHDPGCEPFDLDGDNDVDQTDFAHLQRSLTH